MKKKFRLVVLVLLVMMLTACGIQEAVPATTEVSTVMPTPKATPTPTLTPTPTPEMKYSALLTGVSLEADSNIRPIAVLINNLKPARPQSGLQEADIIWEVLAEGGITRLIAIFQSTAADEVTIGPVRSNRPYFIEIAESYNSVIAHAGASNDAYAILQKQKKPYLDEISNAGPAYWRSKDRKAPHNLYTNLKNLRAQIDKKGYTADTTLKGYSYNYSYDEATPTGSATRVDVKFQLDGYKVAYEYDNNIKQYIRLVNDEQHKDKDTEDLLLAKNLIFFQTKHKVLDSEGRLEVDLKSGGNAMIINEGHVQPAEWIKAEDGMIRFVNNGEEVKILPGKTFIHVLPTGKEITEHVKF